MAKEKDEGKIKENVKSRKPIWIGVIIIVVLLVGFVIAGFGIKVPYTVEVEKEVQVPYEAQEAYEVQEPYEAQEPYKVQEPYDDVEYYTETKPYQEKVSLTYEYGQVYTRSCGTLLNYILCLDVNIENTDTEGGIFKVNCEFRTIHRTLTDYDSTYISPGETKTLKCKADVDLGEDVKHTYQIIPGTKTVTKYRDVTKTRTVTKYKTATKYKTVTKYRTVTKYKTVTKYRTEMQKETVTKYRTLFEEWFG